MLRKQQQRLYYEAWRIVPLLVVLMMIGLLRPIPNVIVRGFASPRQQATTTARPTLQIKAPQLPLCLSLFEHQEDESDSDDDGRRTINSNNNGQRRRRDLLLHTLMIATTTTTTVFSGSVGKDAVAQAAETAAADEQGGNNMYSPKFVQQYSDFIETSEGWSYRDVTPGKGPDKAEMGIGYFGRPFQAKGGPQGGAFDKDVDYLRTVLGSGKMVKGLECGLVGTSVGQVRQIVVPYGLSYPSDDPDHLENPRVDRTLLFNVKVIRVDKPDGKSGFKRGSGA